MLPSGAQLPQPQEFIAHGPLNYTMVAQRLARDTPVAGVRWRESQLGSQRMWWWRATRVVVAAALQWRLLNTRGMSFENSVLWADDGQQLVVGWLCTWSDEPYGEHRLGNRE